MERVLAIVSAIALLAAGALLGLYGLFAILYRGDSGGSGDTYVTLAGHEIDADLVGAVALLLAFSVTLLSVRILRRKRRLGRAC
jgi:hypothetical protein